jgi:predicted helicase
LQGRDGVVCYITNNGFINGVAFDGFRRHLQTDFSQIYHFDLGGNVRTNRRGQSVSNVFDIRVGVGITLAIRKQGLPSGIFWHQIPSSLSKQEKLDYLVKFETVQNLDWQQLYPDTRHSWLVPENADEFSQFLPMGSKAAKRSKNPQTIFATYSGGVKTNRDAIVYDFRRQTLIDRMQTFTEAYNAEVDRYKRHGKKLKGRDLDDFVSYSEIKWSSDLKTNLQRERYADYNDAKIRPSIYRPFTRQFLFFDRLLNERVYQLPSIFPTAASEAENRVIWLKVGSAWPMFALMVNHIPDLLPQSGSQCFPFYTYDEDGGNRRENITDWALQQFQTHYGDAKITKWDIFHYVYALLHHPAYRERYADALKRDLPRLPYAPDFWVFARAGAQLADLHLNYEEIDPYPLTYVWQDGAKLDYRVEKMRLRNKKREVEVNPALTLKGIPPQAYEYKLGNHSALEWVIDQYQVKTDKHSGIESDPNNPDDPDYIVELVGRVVAVSLQTVDIVAGLGEIQ